MASFAALVIWLLVLVQIASHGDFFREWHKEGDEKQFSARITQLSWFAFVSLTHILGVVFYLVWTGVQQWKIRERRKAGIKADTVQHAGLPPEEENASVFRTIGGIIGCMVILLCWFSFIFIAISHDVYGGGRPFMMVVATIFSVVGFMGTPLSMYNTVYGGFFSPLVRFCHPVLRNLPKGQRQERFSLLCVAVQAKYSLKSRHNMLVWVVLALIFCIFLTSLAQFFVLTLPLYSVLGTGNEVDSSVWENSRLLVSVGNYIARGLAGLFVFKVLVWDVAIACLLYRQMGKGGAVPHADGVVA